ncbi:hypothetical protein X989_6201 [Burkholderia pseudomallei MSHR4378]|nr:hypothetical protein X989_6201 [Burkholderia pseudomallei MSHR4378]
MRAFVSASRRSSAVAFGGSSEVAHLVIRHPAVDQLDSGAVRRLLVRHGHAAGGRAEQHLLHAGDAHRRVQAVDRDFHADAPHVRRELRGALAGFRERHAAIRAGEEAQRRADRIRHDFRALHDHLVGLRAHAHERRRNQALLLRPR